MSTYIIIHFLIEFCVQVNANKHPPHFSINFYKFINFCLIKRSVQVSFFYLLHMLNFLFIGMQYFDLGIKFLFLILEFIMLSNSHPRSHNQKNLFAKII